MRRSIRSASKTVAVSLMMSSFLFHTTTAMAQAPANACALLTKEDAAAALGEAAAGPRLTGPITDGSGSTVSACEYTGSGIHSIQLEVRRPPASALPMYKAIICDKKTIDGLDGLGDLACWYNDKHGELHVIKGTTFVSVQLRRSGNPTEPIIAVMKKALARLK